ncbi:serine hydrolase [Collimonas sp. OK242]|uniref:serine hydrolase n=1 Tax=Collimonas sp. OK242 TaxID=1798195 RepID=UPI001C40B581|nr:serine hydrolase [Collimonas sp. OK242]
MTGTSEITDAARTSIAQIAELQIANKNIPGAVIVIGNRSRILYQQHFGNRATVPDVEIMSDDTIFDLASLTKVVATTTAILQLAEQGRIDLDAPVARYWPAFGAHGKAYITVRELLSHTSGLAPDLNLSDDWQGKQAAMQRIVALSPLALPGQRVIYSDINFEVLGVLIERTSHMTLDRYCEKYIFAPLGMHDTAFSPQISVLERVAPTQGNLQHMLRGQVHDPSAARMGGIAGHAGLFSSAADLARFARMILNGGALGDVRILRRATVARLLLPDSPPDAAPLRGLGWALDRPLSANRDQLPPIGMLWHTGFTGTGLWIDPVTQRFVIILSNRVHPDGLGDAAALREQILAVVSSVSSDSAVADIARIAPQLAPILGQFASPLIANGSTRSGIDVLEADGFSQLAGQRIGLITNQSGIDHNGRSTIEILQQAPGVHLAALFALEHGLYGRQNQEFSSGMDPATRLPVHSLYGTVKRPTPSMLAGLDLLVWDVQDAGVRFFTFETSLGYVLEAAAQQGIPVLLLDRPNPLGADVVAGPMLDPGRLSFTGFFPLPVQHGMTIGELGRLFNAEMHIGADLRIVPMQAYARQTTFKQSGLPWIRLSPNLRSMDQLALYPGVSLVEGANVSVGRGTPTPFQLIGAPWINGQQLASELGDATDEWRFEAVDFVPTEDRYRGLLCHGVKIKPVDKPSAAAPYLGILLASALWRLYPQQFQLDQTVAMIGSAKLLDAIRAGADKQQLATLSQAGIAEFLLMRARYLLYPDDATVPAF